MPDTQQPQYSRDRRANDLDAWDMPIQLLFGDNTTHSTTQTVARESSTMISGASYQQIYLRGGQRES